MSRVQQRHLRSGIAATMEEAAGRVKENDLLNAQILLDDGAMERAQIVLQQKQTVFRIRPHASVSFVHGANQSD